MFAQEYMDYLLNLVSRMPEKYRHDVVADVIIHVFDNDVDLPNLPDAKRYLRNRAQDMLSKHKKHDRFLPIMFDVADKKEPVEIFKLTVEDLRPAVETMPEYLQETFYSLAAGKSVDELAEAEQVTQFAIWRRIRKIRQFVSKWSKSHFPDMGELL